MKSPVESVCGDPECVNNANGKRTLCCSACGKCGDHSHQDCATVTCAFRHPFNCQCARKAIARRKQVERLMKQVMRRTAYR